MDELNEELGEGGVSRRDALKKIGVTAAGFWAVPVISSFRSPALGIVSPVCSGNPFVCGDEAVLCGTSGANDCYCATDVHGVEGCFVAVFCSTLQPCEATPFDEFGCPPGFRCLDDTCCDVNPVCVPVCGTSVTTFGDASARVQRGGPTPFSR